MRQKFRLTKNTDGKMCLLTSKVDKKNHSFDSITIKLTASGFKIMQEKHIIFNAKLLLRTIRRENYSPCWDPRQYRREPRHCRPCSRCFGRRKPLRSDIRLDKPNFFRSFFSKVMRIKHIYLCMNQRNSLLKNLL